MSRFSERHGYKSIKQVVQRESIDEALQNGLWNAIDLFFCRTLGNNWISHLNGMQKTLLFRLWTEHFELTWDTISGELTTTVIQKLRNYFFNCKWYEVYDLLEFLAEELPGESSQKLLDYANGILEREKSAYRFVGRKIAEITSQQEIEAVEAALADSQPFSGIHNHLERALELYKERPESDYRNSVKEAISAVESLACLIAGDTKATLGEALDRIEKKSQVKVHVALKRAFKVLYGYTNDEEGIRHKMLDEDSVGQAEALYMLVACSAFVSYLISKAADAKIELSTD